MVNRGSCKSGLWDQSGLVNCQCLHFINAVLFEWSEKLDHVFQSATTISVLSEADCEHRSVLAKLPLSLSLFLSALSLAINALSSCRSSIFILILSLLLPDEPHLDEEIKAAINLQTSFTHQIAALSLFHYFWLTDRTTAHLLIITALITTACIWRKNGSGEEVARRVIGL